MGPSSGSITELSSFPDSVSLESPSDSMGDSEGT